MVTTKVIKIDQPSQIAPAVAQAAEILRQGGLVGFPTETVYGLAANAGLPDSLARLHEVKHRPPDQPSTLHIGAKSQVDRYVPGLSLLDKEFLRKAWPGPLTVIFDLKPLAQKQLQEIIPSHQWQALYRDGTIGIRLPDQPVAQQLLSALDDPIVAPSANIANQPAPNCAEDVLQQLDGQIDLLLDAGPTRYAKSSTIIRLSDGDMEILRPGVLDEGTLTRMRSLTILFVCTGNSCRSPMAQGLCCKALAEKIDCPIDELSQKGYKVLSAGVMAFDGGPASAEAVQACREAGVDISQHRAQRLTQDLVSRADYVFVMDRSHGKGVTDTWPQAAERTQLLGGENDIADPIGGDLDVYRSCAQQIDRGVHERLNEIG